MTCSRCGADVITRFAGATPVYRHAVTPKDPHYPRVLATGNALPRPSEPPEGGGVEGHLRPSELRRSI